MYHANTHSSSLLLRCSLTVNDPKLEQLFLSHKMSSNKSEVRCDVCSCTFHPHSNSLCTIFQAKGLDLFLNATSFTPTEKHEEDAEDVCAKS